MKHYTRPRRQIVILALRYAISHIAADIEGKRGVFPVAYKKLIAQMESQLADMQAMHRNLTGTYFPG